ncbi:carbohydrate ABC transporter permease [Aureimonas leprariae]|uniref:sn-glycerol-3-phosphate transport system permease protein UgpE n=2 Tax=Plantimonas leprariae TaxID=2615207 RepID=A0A7V7PMS2_9HYPH|nr:carbohydrate ABC transporter permease [Aureimonas leprariae]
MAMKGGDRLRWIVLFAVACLWLLPIVSLVLFSFAPSSQILGGKLIPSSYTLSNYVTALTDAGRGVSIPQAMANSALIMAMQVAGILLLDIPAAYAFGRLRWPGRDLAFALVLLTMMMPGILEVLSLYEIMSGFGLVDTIYAVVLPGLPRVVGIFILRQFFRELPKEMEDAARMDGAGSFQIFWHVMVPLARPAVLTLSVLTALYSWNNFLWPLIITNSPASMTVPVAIAYLSADTSAILNYTVILAASFLTALPMILIFLLGQKYIVGGMRPTAGIK